MKKKSLNAKKIILNNFNFKKYLKDKKIFKIYNSFEKNFESLNCSNKIALSVSGGPDSMTLCFLICCYKSVKNKKLRPFFYIVDHGLRKETAKEALLIKKELKFKKINLNILKWRGKKPKSNIQNLARQNRYNLLFKECNKHNIKNIFTAHHQDDVYETFFIRLIRGSGTEGLSSFSEIKKNFFYKGNKITVVRPLLNFTKQDLVYVAQKVFNFYINDPSNKIDKFQRVMLRKLIDNLKNQGFDFRKLKLTINNLASTNRAINEVVKTNISKNISLNNKRYLIGPNFFSYPEEIVFRSISKLIKKISKKDYPPRGKKIINLIRELKNKDQIKATLGGTIIEKIHNSVVVREEKTKKS